MSCFKQYWDPKIFNFISIRMVLLARDISVVIPMFEENVEFEVRI